MAIVIKKGIEKNIPDKDLEAHIARGYARVDVKKQPESKNANTKKAGDKD